MDSTHGGDIIGFQEKYGAMPLDFSASCNPRGLPEAVRQAVCAAVSRAHVYPDPSCRQLRAEMAGFMHIPPEWIGCGNGASDLIWRLAALAGGKRVLVTAPTFSEYETASAACGGKVERFVLRPEEGFAVTGRLLDALSDDLSILWLCNPNNPTSLTVETGLMRQILERCGKLGIILVVDECFNGFLDNPGQHSLAGQLAGNRHLIILNAFTKLYGMAGLRLGYGLSSDVSLIKDLMRAGPPWPVSSIAQAAGIAVLAEHRYLDDSRRLITEERRYLAEALTALGYQVIGGEANFFFFRSHIAGLHEKLCCQGILIRDCANFPGLAPGYYRIAVRAHGDNAILIRVLEDLSRT